MKQPKVSGTLLILPLLALVNDINAEESLIASTALQYFFRFITADLAHRRELGGVTHVLIQCFTILRRTARDDRIRKTSVQPAPPPGQMALHHLSSQSREADVGLSRGILESWLGRAGWTAPSA